MRKMSLFIVIIVLLTQASALRIIHAQDEPPVITATVIYPTVNIRWMPEARLNTTSDLDSRIGQLHRNETLTAYLWENIASSSFGEYTWVYATQNGTNLTGWVRADLLYFENDQWRTVLPVIDTWEELGVFVAERAPNGVEAVVVPRGNYYLRINVREAPFQDAPKIAEIPTRTVVTVLGRALSDGEPLGFVYVRDNQTGVEGWVSDKVVSMFGARPLGLNSALPVLYEVVSDDEP